MFCTSILPTRRRVYPQRRPSADHRRPRRPSEDRAIYQFPTYNSRPFTSALPSPPLQTLTATRILPYATPPLFDLIADISSYPSFIPYLHSSTVTSSCTKASRLNALAKNVA